ncbi:putative gustatory receptor 47b [Anastrepha obliqua]|uniref:putative gustatory receptor 47b n=1 Tax=Anastrepha obliqua TaxID=95512 RepID=UPI002409CF09|nr:putative gustatory receptor 47b [Anastrepha obliqua]
MNVLTKKTFKNINCIYYCFKWIYIFAYYAGCICFQLRERAFQFTKCSIAYTNFIRIAILLGFVGSMIVKCLDNESSKAMLDRLSPVLKLTLALECFISAITYAVASASMEKNKYKLMRLMQSFQVLDHRMQIEFPYVNWNYHKTERKFTSITLFLIAYYYIVAFIYVFKLANCNCDYATTIVFALSYATLTSAPGFITFLNLGLMDLQRIRFRLIRRLLKQNYASAAHITGQTEFEMRLARLINYCKGYIQLVLQMNDVFGVACGVDLFHDFAILTSMTFLVCQRATESNARLEEYTSTLLFMLPRMYKVTIYTIYGYVAHKERQNCTHEAIMCGNYFRRSKAIRYNLEAFLHWRMHNTYSLLIGKVTRCNLALLCSIFNSIISSVIILIQLQFQQNSITTTRLKKHGMMYTGIRKS